MWDLNGGVRCIMGLHSIISSTDANSLEYYVLNIVASGTREYCVDLLPFQNVIIQPGRWPIVTLSLSLF